MLIRITNSCEMGCTHCMVNATPNGEHMSRDTFERALEFVEDIDVKMVFLSGGEPTDHPEFMEFAKLAIQKGFMTLIMSNGMFLEDEKKKEEILGLGIPIQITNDERYYPRKVPVIKHPSLAYESQLRVMTPLGRAEGQYKGTGNAPMCFNLRIALMQTRDLREAIGALRQKVKMCTPSVNVNGDVVAGESSLCYKIGDVWSRRGMIAQGIMNLRCNKCGCEDNLSDEMKKFAGLA